MIEVNYFDMHRTSTKENVISGQLIHLNLRTERVYLRTGAPDAIAVSGTLKKQNICCYMLIVLNKYKYTKMRLQNHNENSTHT